MFETSLSSGASSPHTRVSDLAPLRELTQLQWLGLDGPQVSDLKPLRKLIELQVLDLHGTQVSDLEPLRGLTQLQKLYLGNTKVSDIEPLVGMKGVTIHLGEEQQVTGPEELADRVRRQWRPLVRLPSP